MSLPPFSPLLPSMAGDSTRVGPSAHRTIPRSVSPQGTDTPPLRLVLDTNVIMDLLHFADPHLDRLRSAILAGTVRCFTDAECLAELERVTGYPAFRLDEAGRESLMWRYRQFVELCPAPEDEETGSLPRCRDPDDQKFLILAARCEADLLVSRDKLLLKLARHRYKKPPFGIVTGVTAVEHLPPERHADNCSPLPRVPPGSGRQCRFG